MKPSDLPPNMAEKIVIDDNGCWLWTGAKTGPGYGSVSVNRRIHNAHRISYILLVGEPESGLVLDHLCRVRHCVNPDHLEPVTQAENVRRSSSNTDTCKRGHAWTPENWRIKSNGQKQCHVCLLMHYRARNARIAAERAS